MTMFANVPDVTCLAPASGEQMLDMLAWTTGPSEHGVVAIRMPGEQILALERAADMAFDPLQRAEEHDPAVNIAGACPFARYQIVQPGRDVAILGLGNTMPLAAEITSHWPKMMKNMLRLPRRLLTHCNIPRWMPNYWRCLPMGIVWLLRWKMAS